MLIVIGRPSFARALAAVQKDVLEQVNNDLRGIRSVADLSAKVKSLREQVEALEISKARKEEEFARKERELEHKVGLHKAQSTFEVEKGKREATLAVREENLAADRKRFEEQMKFHDDRFTAEVGYLKDTLAQMMKRLPTAELLAEIVPRRSRR